MEPITWTVALNLLLKYGPDAVLFAQKMVANIKAGRGNAEVTDAEWAELIALGNRRGEDIYAQLNIPPPPPA